MMTSHTNPRIMRTVFLDSAMLLLHEHCNT